MKRLNGGSIGVLVCLGWLAATKNAAAQVPVLDEPPAPSASPPTPGPAPAPSPAPVPSPAQGPSSKAGSDSVHLKDGTVLKGTVVRQDPGKYVIIRTAEGEQTLTWDAVSRVVVGSSNDVTETSSSQSQALVGKQGLQVGVSGEHVVKLQQPGNSFWQFAIDGGFMYGKSTKSQDGDISLYGGGAEINVQYRVGGQFPNEAGGTWSGFGLDVSGGVFGAGIVEKIGNQTMGSGFIMENFGVSAGYQFFNFGAMDDADLKQHGFGLLLAGKVGFANTTIPGQDGAPSQSQGNAQYGPQIQLTFPEYNFGSTKRAAFYINGYILPTGDFIFGNINLGGSFN